jgi:hypothetical protein
MNTSRKRYVSDADGVVHIDLPTGTPGTAIEVLAIWEEAPEEAAIESSTEDWTDLFGCLKDTPIVRAPQGSFETRDALK